MISEARVRQAVKARDKGRCRRCGQAATELHHRINRGAGGSRTVRVCGVAGRVSLCHGCHSYITEHPEEARATGWSILRNSNELPSEIPLIDAAGLEFFLTEQGETKYTGRIVRPDVDKRRTI